MVRVKIIPSITSWQLLILFVVSSMRSSITTKVLNYVRIYKTTRPFYKSNFMKKNDYASCREVMIWIQDWTKSLCFVRTRVYLRVWLWYTQHFWEFPFYGKAHFGISILPPVTMGIPTLPPTEMEYVTFQLFNLHQKLNSRCRHEKSGLI